MLILVDRQIDGDVFGRQRASENSTVMLFASHDVMGMRAPLPCQRR